MYSSDAIKMLDQLSEWQTTELNAGSSFLKTAKGRKGRVIANCNQSRRFWHKDKIQWGLYGNYLFAIIEGERTEGLKLLPQLCFIISVVFVAI